MREKLAAIEGEGAQLLAVDPHEVWSAKFLLKETGLSTDDLQFPLLMDPAQTVSATYGVAMQMRVHTELSNRPATFLIDREGVIRYVRLGMSFGDRPTADEMLDEIKRQSGDQAHKLASQTNETLAGMVAHPLRFGATGRTAGISWNCNRLRPIASH